MSLDTDTGEIVAAPDAVYWELEPGERPVWHGRPNAAAFVATTTRWGRTFMGLPFVAVGFILTPIAHPLGILFVLVGGGMLAAPLWNWLKARNTIYVVTNHRIMVIEHVLRQSVASFAADSIGRVERRQSHRGCGSLVFCRIETRVNREDGYNHSMVEEKGFFGLRDVGAAWQVVMNLKNRSA
jgi:hypothetical protein